MPVCLSACVYEHAGRHVEHLCPLSTYMIERVLSGYKNIVLMDAWRSRGGERGSKGVDNEDKTPVMF